MGHYLSQYPENGLKNAGIVKRNFRRRGSIGSRGAVLHLVLLKRLGISALAFEWFQTKASKPFRHRVVARALPLKLNSQNRPSREHVSSLKLPGILHGR